ncbi:hypothetical protein SARC_05552, partial [Sphaeroforma arctica JP610]
TFATSPARRKEVDETANGLGKSGHLGAEGDSKDQNNKEQLEDSRTGSSEATKRDSQSSASQPLVHELATTNDVGMGDKAKNNTQSLAVQPPRQPAGSTDTQRHSIARTSTAGTTKADAPAATAAMQLIASHTDETLERDFKNPREMSVVQQATNAQLSRKSSLRPEIQLQQQLNLQRQYGDRNDGFSPRLKEARKQNQLLPQEPKQTNTRSISRYTPRIGITKSFNQSPKNDSREREGDIEGYKRLYTNNNNKRALSPYKRASAPPSRTASRQQVWDSSNKDSGLSFVEEARALRPASVQGNTRESMDSHTRWGFDTRTRATERYKSAINLSSHRDGNKLVERTASSSALEKSTYGKSAPAPRDEYDWEHARESREDMLDSNTRDGAGYGGYRGDGTDRDYGERPGAFSPSLGPAEQALALNEQVRLQPYAHPQAHTQASGASRVERGGSRKGMRRTPSMAYMRSRSVENTSMPVANHFSRNSAANIQLVGTNEPKLYSRATERTVGGEAVAWSHPNHSERSQSRAESAGQSRTEVSVDDPKASHALLPGGRNTPAHPHSPPPQEKSSGKTKGTANGRQQQATRFAEGGRTEPGQGPRVPASRLPARESMSSLSSRDVVYMHPQEPVYPPFARSGFGAPFQRRGHSEATLRSEPYPMYHDAYDVYGRPLNPTTEPMYAYPAAAGHLSAEDEYQHAQGSMLPRSRLPIRSVSQGTMYHDNSYTQGHPATFARNVREVRGEYHDFERARPHSVQEQRFLVHPQHTRPASAAGVYEQPYAHSQEFRTSGRGVWGEEALALTETPAEYEAFGDERMREGQMVVHSADTHAQMYNTHVHGNGKDARMRKVSGGHLPPARALAKSKKSRLNLHEQSQLHAQEIAGNTNTDGEVNSEGDEDMDGMEVDLDNPIPYACKWPGCTMRTNDMNEMRAHVAYHSSARGDDGRMCETCKSETLAAGKPLSSINANNCKHTRNRRYMGPKPHACMWLGCDKRFLTKGESESHMRTHTGEKPFKCDWDGCSKRFAQKGTMERHVRTHTGEKPFSCPYEGCDKTFAQKGNLEVHSRTHTGERPYECQWGGCEKRFSYKSALDFHIRTHTGYKPYQCTWEGCGRRFTQQGNVDSHMRIHSDSSVFTCSVKGCGLHFQNVSERAAHVDTHFDSEEAETAHDVNTNTNKAA